MAKKPEVGSFAVAAGETSVGIFQYVANKAGEAKKGPVIVRVKTKDVQAELADMVKTAETAVSMLNKGTLKKDAFKTSTIFISSLKNIISDAKKAAKAASK